MIQFILMLLGLAFSNNNANTTTIDNNPNPVTVQSGIPGSGVDPGGSEGDTSGGSGQKPPQ